MDIGLKHGATVAETDSGARKADAHIFNGTLVRSEVGLKNEPTLPKAREAANPKSSGSNAPRQLAQEVSNSKVALGEAAVKA